MYVIEPVQTSGPSLFCRVDYSADWHEVGTSVNGNHVFFEVFSGPAMRWISRTSQWRYSIRTVLFLEVKLGTFVALRYMHRSWVKRYQKTLERLLQIHTKVLSFIYNPGGLPAQSRSCKSQKGTYYEWFYFEEEKNSASINLCFSCSWVSTEDHNVVCVIFSQSHLLFDSISSPQENSEPKPVVTFLSEFRSSPKGGATLKPE